MSAAHFPSDLWLEILARLPVKTLVRFKSVCKNLCLIIEDPYFMSKHLRQYYLDGGHGDTTTQLLSLHVLGDENRCKISLRRRDTLTETTQLVVTSDKLYSLEGSCLGLTLIISHYPRRQVRLWNPSIRKSILIPPCPFINSPTSRPAYALGFSPSTHHFKVAAFQCSRSSVAVYTVGDDDSSSVWRILTHDCSSANIPIPGPIIGMNPLFLQGALHWFVYDETKSQMAPSHLVSFDFDSEKFSWVELPPDIWEKENIAENYLFLLGEELAFMSFSEVKRCIWVMKKDDCGVVSWHLSFSCDSSDERYRFSDDSKFYHVNGGTKFTYRNYSYDIATSKRKRLVECDRRDTFVLETYLESMALNKQGQPFP